MYVNGSIRTTSIVLEWLSSSSRCFGHKPSARAGPLQENGFPRFSDLLVYDRQAILSGELWRLLTAPLVHFSASHLFWDVVVFSLAGFAINAANFRSLWLVCCIASVLPGILFLLTLPELGREDIKKSVCNRQLRGILPNPNISIAVFLSPLREQQVHCLRANWRILSLLMAE